MHICISVTVVTRDVYYCEDVVAGEVRVWSLWWWCCLLCYISPIMCPLVCVSLASHARPLLLPPGLQTSAEQDEDCECLL